MQRATLYSGILLMSMLSRVIDAQQVEAWGEPESPRTGRIVDDMHDALAPVEVLMGGMDLEEDEVGAAPELDAEDVQIPPLQAQVLWQKDIWGITARLTREPLGLTWRVLYPLGDYVTSELTITQEQAFWTAMGIFLSHFFLGVPQEGLPAVDVTSTICVFAPEYIDLRDGRENPALIINGLMGDQAGAFQDIFDRLIAWRTAAQNGDQAAVQSIKADFVRDYRLPVV